jgi:ribosomal protein S18 acetylase RimI-like enzyme
VTAVTGARSLSIGDDHLRVLPWRGDHRIAYVVARRGRPTDDQVRRCLAGLAERFDAVLTAALPPEDQGPYLRTGFTVHERLHLLKRPVEPVPATVGEHHLVRGRRRDRDAVLAIDGAAFPAFWRLDAVGLDDALSATPSVRYRVAVDEARRPVGYAVTGRAGARGYLQRLAVQPTHQGTGIGGALVADGLRWLRRWSAREVLVNTQEDNVTALRLYERLGFAREPEGLAVLRRELGGTGA